MNLRIRPEWLSAPGYAPDSPELESDRATLAAIEISAAGECLSRLTDTSGKERDYVCVSGYRLAEWISRKWWRLLFEAERHGYVEDPNWLDGHSLASIGEGWIWPRVTIAADGESVVLRSRPSRANSVEPLDFATDAEERVSRAEFEQSARRFVAQVLDRLETWSPERSDLHVLWRELEAERSDPEFARYRALEGSMGYEPDEAPPQVVERLQQDGERLGVRAMAEVAATGRSGEAPLTAHELERKAFSSGFESSFRDPSWMADLTGGIGVATEPAWGYGEAAAREVRRHARLGDGPIVNQGLADLCGADVAGLSEDARFEPLAFALDRARGRGSVVFRSGWETGRRFELARLLGDGLLFGNGERLHPANRAETFRQRAQRAFAAGLLCPYDALSDFLGGDVSATARGRAARHFEVSERVVTTILVNKRDLSRDQLVTAGD